MADQKSHELALRLDQEEREAEERLRHRLQHSPSTSSYPGLLDAASRYAKKIISFGGSSDSSVGGSPSHQGKLRATHRSLGNKLSQEENGYIQTISRSVDASGSGGGPPSPSASPSNNSTAPSPPGVSYQNVGRSTMPSRAYEVKSEMKSVVAYQIQKEEADRAKSQRFMDSLYLLVSLESPHVLIILK
jgi:hypothetical protein